MNSQAPCAGHGSSGRSFYCGEGLCPGALLVFSLGDHDRGRYAQAGRANQLEALRGRAFGLVFSCGDTDCRSFDELMAWVLWRAGELLDRAV